MEQTQTYDVYMNLPNPDDATLTGFNAFFGDNDSSAKECYLGARMWEALSTSTQDALGSVPFVKCPSRRASGALNAPILTGTSGQSGAPGPITDYAAVVRDRRGDAEWWECIQTGQGYGDNNFTGPIRSAVVTGIEDDKTVTTANYTNWTCRDTFASWTDGSSNCIIVGEKHVPLSRLGMCYDSKYTAPAGSADVTYYQWDCTYFHQSRRGRQYGATRIMCDGTEPDGTTTARPIISNPHSGENLSPEWGASFGSYHAGIANFLLGDGSVRSISSTVPAALLTQLADVRDGAVVTIP